MHLGHSLNEKTLERPFIGSLAEAGVIPLLAKSQPANDESWKVFSEEFFVQNSFEARIEFEQE